MGKITAIDIYADLFNDENNNIILLISFLDLILIRDKIKPSLYLMVNHQRKI